MKPVQFLADRTLVLFLGVAAGTAIGYAFADKAQEPVQMASPEAAPIVDAPAAIAPPPPTAPAAPETPADRKPEPETPAETATVAEPANAPATVDRPSAQLADSVRQGGAVRVGVFGDSFGDGVWSALYRLLPAKDGFRVTKYSQQSTGFTRYRRLNLEEHDEQQIAGDDVDVAVISFGANDAQGVCDGGHCGALMSTYWQQVIGQRVTNYVTMLRRHGAAVYWVGLPVMRDPAFDGQTQAMDSFYKRLMGQLGVPYIDIRPLTTDADGKYQAYYRDADGSPKLFRAGDGVHMSMNGYIRVTKGLAGRIRATAAAAKGEGA
ncbi:DUF459 domain-containing protein [uncultured Sphingomonas sp.]|uniref:SGNH/GDSL hydrolase family protein n=1 Tax=uncultured Sphingomonas sp. TaxID=158754 RepID=UPI0025D4D5BF|nr:DUF459 domain-containing protein [uncultured Sphingomonas sp.]